MKSNKISNLDEKIKKLQQQKKKEQQKEQDEINKKFFSKVLGKNFTKIIPYLKDENINFELYINGKKAEEFLQNSESENN